jgi:polyhydroxybutyrate depolymerase
MPQTKEKNMAHINRLHLQFIIVSILLVSATSCNQTFATPTPTIAPTATPALTATPAPTLQPSNTEHKITVHGVERSYLIHIPPGLDSVNSVPLVFVFHGFSGDSADIQMLTGFDEAADNSGFLVVYPLGIGGSWNAIRCCGNAASQNVDEPAFIREILSDIGSIASVDTKRIYATGFSNGAMLSYRLACEMSDVFAAVGPVAGALISSPCEPQEPVSLIHVHALNDTDVPYGEGFAPDLPSAEDSIITWAQMNDCTGSAQVDKQLNDSLTHTAYTSCKAGTAVESYVFETGGHFWPSKYVWDAPQAMWDFFAAHPKP